jgi:hypothetical protein
MTAREEDKWRQVNVTLPDWMIERLDRWQDAVRRTRSAVIADMIERRAASEDEIAVSGGVSR